MSWHSNALHIEMLLANFPVDVLLDSEACRCYCTFIIQTLIVICSGRTGRIGIVRALLNNPNIIILDEATSGLDTFTETQVLGTINKIKKTVIIVSHRINTLKFCDKVYSIDKNTLKLINKLS